MPARQGEETFVDNVELGAPALALAGTSPHRLLYATPDLAEPIHISGFVRVSIRLAASKPAANLSVYLVQLPWTGTNINTTNLITRGWADPQDLLRFQQSLLAGDLFRDPHTVRLLTERRNRLRNAPVLQYGLGTMFFRVGRVAAPGRDPVTLVGHSGATGTWLFHSPELDLHLAGTIDQARGQSMPFRIMTRMLHACFGAPGWVAARR